MAEGVQVFEIREARPSGIGDDDIDPAQLLDSFFDQTRVVIGVACVLLDVK